MLENVLITLAVYRRSMSRAAAAVFANWPVAGTVFVYVAILVVTARIVAPLGIAGGFILSLVSSACFASFLYLLEQIVRGSRVTLEDFARSFLPYLGDVVGVGFVLWIIGQVLVALALNAGGVALALGIQLVIFVLFNAVPELIYLGHHPLLALFTESYSFVVENWIEWFPPNLVLVLAYFALSAVPASGAFVPFQLAALALYAYFAMAFRGFLFLELAGSSRRSRLFRWKSERA